MKLFKFLPFALAITAMVGCSDDNFVETPGDSGILEEGGTVTVNISLPSTSVRTRAEIYDGDKNEYAVENGTVVLFDEFQNVIVKQVFTAKDLGFDTNNTPNNVTSSSQTIVIPEKSATPKYVLALLNITPEVSVALNAAASFKDFQIALNGNRGINDNGYFFMANSTFDNTGNSQENVHRSKDGLQDLQEVDSASIGQSQSSKPASATKIYVERAAAKVDLTFGLGNQITTGEGKVQYDDDFMPIITFSTGDKLLVKGWGLTVTNNSYYPVKYITPTIWEEWKDATVYQMAATKAVSSPTDFRSHWAIDPNYSGDLNADENGFYSEFTYISYSQANNKTHESFTKTIPLYCLENTFVAANQYQNQTTSILVAAQYVLKGENAEKHVYTINGNVYSGSELRTYVTSILNSLGYKDNGNTLREENFIIAPKQSIYTDIVKFRGTSLVNSSEAVVAINDEYINGVLETVLGGKTALAFYHEGRCHYTIPIRHFDDSQVKLYDLSTNDYYIFNGTKVKVNSIDQLGRYGIVRNNWYSVNVGSINQIGRPGPVDPEVPTPIEPNPDDTESYYLNAEISILPWAKRSQNADL